MLLVAASECRGVLPKPEATPVVLGDVADINSLWCWTASNRDTVIRAKGSVCEAVYMWSNENRIYMPCPSDVTLLGNQAEEIVSDLAIHRKVGAISKDTDPDKPSRISPSIASGGDK